MKAQYIAIDLKSFYASVECVERGYDPLTTNLVVADESRTEKTICLAVSPSLKAYGIPGRARLFEVIEQVRRINERRLLSAPRRRFTGKSFDADELYANAGLALDYVVAPPRMERYMECSAGIYDVYLQYIAPEDIHVYSIDEVFIDATHYLKTYRMTGRELAAFLMREVYNRTGVTATAGVGTNLFLCKVAMDVVAKHAQPDETGARIAELDEQSFREQLWTHRPLTDFWRVGSGLARKLEANGMFTMGDIARCSLGKPHETHSQALLYKLFGVNAELLIDHAWGYESCTLADIKAYRPESNSISAGQVLARPYDFAMAKLIVREMTDQLAMDLVDKGLQTDQLVLTVCYENLKNLDQSYEGRLQQDHYGRLMPKSAHGTETIGRYTASTKLLTERMMALYDRIVDPGLPVRRIYVVANRVIPEQQARTAGEQLSLFDDAEAQQRVEQALARERRQQNAVLQIRKRFGKNAIFKGMNLSEGATARERNEQIGGHRKG